VGTTTAGGKIGLNVNCIGGTCSGSSAGGGDGGYTIVIQGPGADGGVNWSVDVASIAGAPTTVGNGVTTANTQRVTISSDSTGQVKLATGANTIGALTANQSVNVAQINGSTTTSGSGVTAAGTQRVVLATDQTSVPVTDNGGSLTVDTPQLPAALVGGRLDTNTGAWLGSTAPTVGQKTSANSVPVVIASDQSAVTVTGTVTITPSGTQTVAGNKTNNAAAPGATNVGALPALANAAAPAWTEGNLVLESVDLSGRERTDTSSIAGTATAVNNGTASAGTQRVVIASDNTAFTVNARTNDSTGNGIESAITEVVGVNRGLLVRPVDKTLTAPVVTSTTCTTASTALPTTANRKSLCIINVGAGNIFFGPTGVTAATGFQLSSGTAWCDDVGSQAYFCIRSAGTADVRTLEN
jgi:hypothetical protein